MPLNLNLPSPLEELYSDLFSDKNVQVYLKRDDLIHAEISGNKWRKLKLNIERFHAGKYDSMLTFGGAYSNHISATAAVGRELGIPTIGIIRGEELTPESNETLKAAKENGMQLHFVSREEYGLRYEKDYKYELREQFGNTLVIEEGGANYYGLVGCTEIISEVPFKPDYYILACGTGTTAAGLLFGAENEKIIGVPVFKKGDFIRDEINQLLEYAGLSDEEMIEKNELLSLETDYHFGGYGKYNDELMQFINETYQNFQIKFDQIYTAKMFFALCDLIKQGRIEEGARVMAIHTGGLQGLSSVAEKLIF